MKTFILKVVANLAGFVILFGAWIYMFAQYR
jgi:hypothetical protein